MVYSGLAARHSCARTSPIISQNGSLCVITSPEHAASFWLLQGPFATCSFLCSSADAEHNPWQALHCVNARSTIHAMSSSLRRAHLLHSPVKWIVLAWTLCAVNIICRAGNILVLPTPLARSHHMGMQAMASELAQRGGHQVMVSPAAMYGKLSAELGSIKRPAFDS